MIEEVTSKNIEEVLPLIKEYQLFYGVEQIDEKRNQTFFSQFTENHDNGILHLYRVAHKAIGFSTIIMASQVQVQVQGRRQWQY